MNRQERRHQKKQANKTPQPAKRDAAVEKLLAEANGYMESGQFAEAEELYRDITARAPTDAEAFHMLALIAYQEGRLPEAGDFILEAITRDEHTVALHANCGAIMNMLGRPQEAEAASRHVINLDASHAEAYNNLSVALEVQGRVDEALEACTEALKLRPDYPEAHINHGNMHLRRGDMIDAVEAYAAAIRVAPDSPMARANMGVALRELGELTEAEAQCRLAIELNADYADAHNSLGNVLVVMGRPGEAVTCFRRAAELRPGYREAEINLAAALHRDGQFEEAERAYRTVIENDGDFAEAHAGLGVVLLTDGRLDDAVAAFRRAIEIKPELGDAHYNLASAVGAEMTDTELSEMRNLAEDSDLPARQRIGIRFALGEAADQRDDTEAAFIHFDAGNELRKQELDRMGQRFDADAHDQFIDEIANLLDRDFVDRHDGSGLDSDVPVFIVGMPRSGTTLVEQIIASHPAVFGAGEANTMSGLIDDYPAGVSDLEVGGLAAMAGTALDRFAEPGAGSLRVADKTPFNFLYLGLIQMLLPGARIIHCLRDPLDTGLSCFFQNFVDVHPWSMDQGDISRYMLAHDRLMNHWRGVLSLPMMEIRYESLLADQEAVSRDVIEFLGLDWDGACLKFFETRRPVLTASNWQVRKPLYSTSRGRAAAYETQLSPLIEGLKG